jgi:hypothetical protein
MAAVTKTVPTLVFSKFAADKIANVVPKDVEQSDAPAVKAVNRLIFCGQKSGIRTKDSAIGTRIPVTATRTERTKFCFSNFKSV